MAKQLDGPFPGVPETFRLLDRGSQNVAGIARNGPRDHREWQSDRASHCLILARTEPEQGWGATGVAHGQGEKHQALGDRCGASDSPIAAGGGGAVAAE